MAGGISMSRTVCPWWLGYFLAHPLRRRIHDPVGILRPFVSEGMTVLEPGPGMGFFTVELDNRNGVDSAARTRIWYALNRHGIEMPVATHRVQLRQGSRQATREDQTVVACDSVSIQSQSD